MPYIDGITRVKKQITPPPADFEVAAKKKVFAWKKLLFALCAVLILTVGGLTTVLAYPKVKGNVDLIKKIGDGRYLILFENNTELRPSGGFIGSFAVAEIKEGKLNNINFDTNIYKRDSVFSKNNYIEPPSVLKEFSPGGLTMRDSNWAVDFPEAATTVAKFYELEGGTPVDGVIAIDTTFFENLLRTIGPVHLSQYNITINADNFAENVQYKIEKEYFNDPRNWSINEPKTILKDLMAEMFTRLEDKKNYYGLIKMAYNALEQKHLVLFSYNNQLENFINNNNWGGKVADSLETDFLFINHANLGANKSSLKVKENVQLENVNLSNTSVDHLKITRTNQSDNTWPYGGNRNYTRVLVPLGTKLLSASQDGGDYTNNIEVATEAGKTSFGFWFETNVLSSKIIELTYQLPAGISGAKYSFYWQKQPGTIGDDLQIIANNKLIFNGWVDKDSVIK